MPMGKLSMQHLRPHKRGHRQRPLNRTENSRHDLTHMLGKLPSFALVLDATFRALRGFWRAGTSPYSASESPFTKCLASSLMYASDTTIILCWQLLRGHAS